MNINPREMANILPFTGVGESCSSHEFFNIANMYFIAIRENKTRENFRISGIIAPFVYTVDDIKLCMTFTMLINGHRRVKTCRGGGGGRGGCEQHRRTCAV